MVEELFETPRFPPRVVGRVPVLVTDEAPRTAKLARAEPNNGVAHAGEEPQNTPITANDSIDNDLSELIVRVLLAYLDAIFMLISVWG
ncbi:hypothetical protein NTG1052_210108 [Candidatus Nitrotoga sp. 1052]|nr:hypothetical protein NTG1052_210108 [Candidatus Nitrotoga sp. 1052]